MVRYAVVNQYGIRLVAERQDDSGYAYIPRAAGEESYRRCMAWIRRHDSANTCAIVEIEATN